MAEEGHHKRAKPLQSNKRALVSTEDAIDKRPRIDNEFAQQCIEVGQTVSQSNTDTMAYNIDIEDTMDLHTGTATSSTDTGVDRRVMDNKFHNIDIGRLYVLEICAGSARLTKAAREHGFRGVAFDHSDSRSCGIEICNVELADPQQLQDLLEFITVEAPNIAAIWIAPSCGAASRARERP